MLTLQGVDWSGRLIGRCSYKFNPIPVIPKTCRIYPMILHWSKVLESSLYPSDPKEILMAITTLKAHFPGQSMSEKENEILIRDYLTDLSIFPADLIEQVCREYRLDGNNKYFPKVGQLYAKLVQYFSIRLAKSNKLHALIEASENERNKQLKSNY